MFITQLARKNMHQRSITLHYPLLEIPSFPNYIAHWLKVFLKLNNMYVLIRGQNNKWHGYVLTNRIDYDE
jgi:hypothetical protein